MTLGRRVELHRRPGRARRAPRRPALGSRTRTGPASCRSRCKYPQLGRGAGVRVGLVHVALDGVVRGVRVRPATTSATGRRRRRSARYRFVVQGPPARGPHGGAVHAALARVRGVGVGRDHGAVDRRTSRDGVSFAVGPVSTYRLPTAEPGGRVETKVSGAGIGRRVATVGPIDYPDSYEGGGEVHRAVAHRAARRRRRRTTRRSSSGSASTARSGRGPTPARRRARRSRTSMRDGRAREVPAVGRRRRELGRRARLQPARWRSCDRAGYAMDTVR